MRTILSIIIMLCCVNLNAQYRQSAYVKTKGTKDKEGERIEGVRVKFTDNSNVYRSDSRGEFDFISPSNKFSIERVESHGFDVLDYDMIGLNYEVSSEQFPIVVVDKKQLAMERDAIYEELWVEFQKNIEVLENELINYNELQKRFHEMADRLARVDYDLKDAIDKEIYACIEKGELAKADSLILSKGSIEDRIEYGNKGDISLLDDCYILSTNAIVRGDIKLALSYLESRVTVAPDNIQCLLDAGDAYIAYQTNGQKSYDYYEQAVYFAKKKYGTIHPKTLECKLSMAMSYILLLQLNEAVNIVYNCLDVYELPDYHDAIHGDNNSDIIKRPVETQADSSIVSRAYSTLINVCLFQSDYSNIYHYIDLAYLYSNDDLSITQLFGSLMVSLCAAGRYQETLDLIDVLLGDDAEIPIDVNTAPVYAVAALCNAQLFNEDEALYQADLVLDFYESVETINDYVFNALLAKTIVIAISEKIDRTKKESMIADVESYFQYFNNTELLNRLYYVNFINNKGLIYFSLDNYNEAEKLFNEAYEAIDDLVEDTEIELLRIKYVILSNIALVHEYTDRIESALDYMQMSFYGFVYLYESIGLDNNDIYSITLGLAHLEMLNSRYYDAFESYKFIYNIFEDNLILSEIDTCYEQAKNDKEYYRKNRKELKKFTKELENFRNTLNQ